MGFPGGPEAVLMQLKLGNRIEIYIVVVGKSTGRRKLSMHFIATSCGHKQAAENWEENHEETRISDFTLRRFLCLKVIPDFPENVYLLRQFAFQFIQIFVFPRRVRGYVYASLSASKTD